MKRDEELKLIDELLALHAAGHAHLEESEHTSAVSRYTCDEVFQREQKLVFSNYPQIAAHSSELAEIDSFIRRTVAGLDLVLTRDADGNVHALVNVCRHRGSQLVAEQSGCARRFSCPYHAWTYDNQGNLIGVPHQRQGFPNLDRDRSGLKRIPCVEKCGFVWLLPEKSPADSIDTYLSTLCSDIDDLQLDQHEVFASTHRTIQANWKVIVEGGLEAYHFRVAHRDTIGPYFLDNLSSYQRFGHHLRSILPRSTLPQLRDIDRAHWNLRAHANVLYTLTPGSQLLVQHDHVVWIRHVPITPAQTELTLTTLVPIDTCEPRREYWQRNHDITITTLDEDFALGEGIQHGFAMNVNAALRFARFEGALGALNSIVDEMLQTPRNQS